MGNFIPIPQTLARLKPYIDIYTVKGGMSVDEAIAGIVSGTESKIGSIESIAVEIKRDTSIWRELNTDRAGLPKEVVPGLPTYELTLNKIALHKDLDDASGKTHDSIMTLFGFKDWNAGFDIISQDKPLMIKLSLVSPRDSNGATISGYPNTGSLLFYGCWLDAFPLKFDVNETDMLIKQEVKAKAAGVIFSS